MNIKDEYIELNLDNIFNENGYIESEFETIYKDNHNVRAIKLIRTKTTTIKIGDFFLYDCENLTTIDLSALSQITQIGNFFLAKCSNLTIIDLSPLSRVTQIGNYFLSYCKNLTTIDLSPLSQVTKIGNRFLIDCSKLSTIDLSPLSRLAQIGNCFLSWCENLTIIDLSPLSQITNIGDCFLSYCKNLTTIIINDNDAIKEKVKNLGVNIEIKSNCEFNTYDKDIDKIKSDKQYTKRLLNWLNIKYAKKNSHNILINKIISEKDKYNCKLSEGEINAICINNDELFTMEELKNIQNGKLVFLNGNKGKYYCFNVIALRNFIFQKQNDKYINPYTNTEFSQEDINKILNVDIKKIKYFCIN
jgi:hypothetical protein